jgi:hypothetical protein
VDIDEVKSRAASIALDRFGEDDDDPAVEIDVSEHFTEAELIELFGSMEDGEWAKVDRLLDAVEGRAGFPDSDAPDVATSEAKAGSGPGRGSAEKLRKYWTVGEGAAKIRWNSPGDMTRCMRIMRKYLGGRAAGYCALRHREMTGNWPGSRANLGS